MQIWLISGRCVVLDFEYPKKPRQIAVFSNLGQSSAPGSL
jgi:hypothetical protein